MRHPTAAPTTAPTLVFVIVRAGREVGVLVWDGCVAVGLTGVKVVDCRGVVVFGVLAAEEGNKLGEVVGVVGVVGVID